MISCSLAARGVTCLSVADFGRLMRSVVLGKEGKSCSSATQHVRQHANADG